jgi:hypothetical protein
MKLYAFLCLALVFSLSSCRYFGGEKVYGDGNVVSQQRNVGAFNSVEANGAVEVHVVQGPAGVKVSADRNLQEYIEVFTEGDVLVVQYKDNSNLEPTGNIEIRVSAPEYKSLNVSGASSITADSPINGTGALDIVADGASKVTLNVMVPKISMDLSGASRINVQGKATEVIAKGSGASDINAMDLVSENADVDVSGASHAELTVNTKMRVEASGASGVRYKGNAAVAQQVSGAGSVEKVN